MSPCIKYRLTQIFGTNYNKCGSHFGATVSSGFHCIANEAREKESDGSQLRPTVTRSEKRKWDKYAQNENKLAGEKAHRKKDHRKLVWNLFDQIRKAHFERSKIS